MLDTLNISLTQGCAYGVMVLGVLVSFRLLDFPDLSVDGTFVLGASVTAVLIGSGVNPFLGLILAILCGFAAGCLTGVLNTKLGVSKLLSGILVMTMLYSINLRVMGRPNMPLLNVPTVTGLIEGDRWLGGFELLVFFAGLAVAIKLLLDWFLVTEWGTVLRAVGDNEQVVKSIGVDTDLVKIVGLGLANSLVALSGSLVAQYQGFADIGMGMGMIVVGIASVLVGESITEALSFIKKHIALSRRRTLAAVIGAFVYQLIIASCLRLGLAPTDLKLATGIMVVAVLLLRSRKRSELASKIFRY